MQPTLASPFLFVGYRVSTQSLTNPYFTLRGPETGVSRDVTVPSYYMSFGRMYLDYNEYVELSTYALDFIYQLILIGSDVNLSAPFIDDEKSKWYANVQYVWHFMFEEGGGTIHERWRLPVLSFNWEMTIATRMAYQILNGHQIPKRTPAPRNI